VNYTVFITPKAKKALETIPSPSYERIEEALQNLSVNPRPPGCKKLKGEEKHWRIRASDYRILYEINDGSASVIVFRIGHRSEVYR